MKLIEFLSHNLQYGERVTLTLYFPYSQKEEKHDCFFTGFRNAFCTARANSDEDIVPVFNQVSKNGKMLSAHLNVSTQLDYILSVSRHDPLAPAPVLTKDEYLSAEAAHHRIEKQAEDQVLATVREIGLLFPGKRIYLDPEAGIAKTVVFESHMQVLCDIVCLYWKDGNVVAGLSDSEGGYQEDVVLTATDPTSWPYLLVLLGDAVRDPWAPDWKDDAFITPGKDSCKDLPGINRKHFPTLTASRLYEEMLNNLWFGSLSDKEKEKEFSSLRNSYQKDKKENKTDLSFPDYINETWEAYNTNARTHDRTNSDSWKAHQSHLD